jgi:acetyltransferase
VIRADTLDDVVEVTEFLAHTGSAGGGRLSAITLSGAFRGLLLDGAERNRLSFPQLAQATTDKLNAVLTVGSLVSNPIDGGFGVLTSADNYKASIAALQADPNVDIVLLQDSLPREPGSARAESYIALVEEYLATTPGAKPMAFVTPTSYSNNDYSRALRWKAPHVSFLQEANKSLRAIASVARRDQLEALRRAADDTTARTDAQRAVSERLRKRAGAQSSALNEADSKEVLRAYGIATPNEVLATSRADALAAAGRIGYPVVLKAVADTLTHKSDVGAVALNLATPEALGEAYDRMAGALKDHKLAGMLVAQQVRGGLELVLGLHRDPEMGLIVMAGTGGVLLELIKDVAFCAPPVSRDKARDMLRRTRAYRLVEGYRGSAPRDLDAIVDALVGLGRLAVDLPDVIESVDINPFVALPKGGLALDALVVLRKR